MSTSPNVPVPGVTVTLAGNTSPGQGGGMPPSVRELVGGTWALLNVFGDRLPPDSVSGLRARLSAVEAHYAKEVR